MVIDMRAIIGQARVDYKERSRSFSFLAIISLCLFGAYWFVPRTGDGLMIMAFEPDIFVQGGHPSWIPISSAVALAFFLPLIGFFYLRNGVQYDEKVGLEQLISSSTVGNFRYFIGKFLSGTLLLYTFAIVVIAGAFFMMLWHYTGQFLSVRAFLSPYMFLLITLPLCSALAILFGSARILRGAIGSIIYAICIPMLMVPMLTVDNPNIILRLLDTSAMANIIEVMSRSAYQQTGYTIDSFMLVYVTDSAYLYYTPLHNVIFDNLSYTFEDFIVMGIWLLVVAMFIALSALFYGITKRHPARPGSTSRHPAWPDSTSNKTQTSTYKQRHEFVYNSVSPAKNLMSVRGIFAEIKLMLKGQHFIWYLVSIIGFASTLFLEISMVQTIIMPLLCLWFVNIFSGLGSREHNYNMLQIIATIPTGKLKQITFSWIAGLAITSTLALPTIVRLTSGGQLTSAFAVLAGVVFLPSFAMFLGEFFKSSRLFEMSLIVVSFAIINGIPLAMYMGYANAPSHTQALVYLALGLVFGVTTVYKRYTPI